MQQRASHRVTRPARKARKARKSPKTRKPREKPVAIMLRKLDPELVKRIDELARDDGISRTRATVRLLEVAAGLRRKPSRKIDPRWIDKYVGTWTEEEDREFREATAWFEQIDPEMWK